MSEIIKERLNLDIIRQQLYNPVGDIYTSWHDLYGAVHLVCAYCGIKSPYHSFRFFWNHGVMLPVDCKVPGRLRSGLELSKCIPVWLHHEYSASQFQVATNNVHVVGAPWLYIPAISEPRIPNSTLIMPGHTLFPTTQLDNQKFDLYVEQMVRVVPPSEMTYVCLTSSCAANGYWITEFSRRGYKIVIGARHNDAASLLRMKSYFQTFETVVSNTYGSHIAYAASEGCRVGIWGHEILDDVSVDDAWKSSKISFSQYSQDLRDETNFLRCEPGSEQLHVDWGRFVLGVDYKKSPTEIYELLLEAQRYSESYEKKRFTRKIIGLLTKYGRKRH